jgi:membrane protease YdiL (CAAX protease family)
LGRAVILIYGAQAAVALVVVVAAGLVSLFGAARLIPEPQLTVPAGVLCLLWGMGVTWYYAARKQGQPSAEALALRVPGRSSFIIGGALGLAGAAAGALIAIKYSDERSLFAGLFTGGGGSWVTPVTVLLMGLLPLYDELLYRGLVFRVLRDYAGPAAIPLTALWFGLSYLLLEWGNWAGLLVVAVLGLSWSLLRWFYGSILPSLLGHALYTWLMPVLVALGGGR